MDRSSGSLAESSSAASMSFKEKSEGFKTRKDSGYLSPQSRSRTPENVLDDNVFRGSSSGATSSGLVMRRSNFFDRLDIERDDY